MNVKRFVGKNAREAIAQARGAWGDQAVVLSNRPIPGGVEILAMAGAEAPMHSVRGVPVEAEKKDTRHAPPMSTLSFQQFVRDRQQVDAEPQQAAPSRQPPKEPGGFARQALEEELVQGGADKPAPRLAAPTVPAKPATTAAPDPVLAELAELRSMHGAITSQLSGMAWFDTTRRDPAQTQLLRQLMANGFSPALARSLVGKLPGGSTEAQADRWLLEVLSRNLRCAPAAESIAVTGGVFALVGPTGVGKTTTTAKIAANFAREHGAASIGLISADMCRTGVGDQLLAFGRLLNIPVHTARDGTALTDLLNLFDRKKLVLVDTVGIGQRDRRLPELFAALPADRVTRLLVLNAAAQAESLEETAQAYGAAAGSRCVITKLDESVKCGGVIDLAIRRQLVIEGFANGQRVPDDWHEARARLLVQKSLLKQAASVYTPDDGELGLMFTAPVHAQRTAPTPIALH